MENRSVLSNCFCIREFNSLLLTIDQVITNKWLILSFGRAERSFRMIVASDGKLSEKDMERYVNQVSMLMASSTVQFSGPHI